MAWLETAIHFSNLPLSKTFLPFRLSVQRYDGRALWQLREEGGRQGGRGDEGQRVQLIAAVIIADVAIPIRLGSSIVVLGPGAHKLVAAAASVEAFLAVLFVSPLLLLRYCC